ncbi:MAG TPA: hypothetical protein VHR86_07380, partial [Armatimonadota bacterium]|nr:hypothetical protein [Armatimonadota bacterium]
VETQLTIACKLGYVEEGSLNSLLGDCARVKQMLYKLMQSLAAPVPVISSMNGPQSGKRETGNGKRSYE